MCQTARGLSVRPKRGDVLLFYNAQPMTAAADYWPWHGSCEVTRGEKWAANLWFHAGARARGQRDDPPTRAPRQPIRSAGSSDGHCPACNKYFIECVRVASGPAADVT